MVAYIGSLLLSLCAIPLAVDAIKGRHIKMNPYFFYSWFFGEVLLATAYYHDTALMINYSVNIICLLIVKVKECKDENDI